MVKRIMLVVFLLGLLLPTGILGCKGYAVKPSTEGEKVVKKVYTCPMCGGEFDKAGKCPKCGMNLIEKK